MIRKHGPGATDSLGITRPTYPQGLRTDKTTAPQPRPAETAVERVGGQGCREDCLFSKTVVGPLPDMGGLTTAGGPGNPEMEPLPALVRSGLSGAM